MNGRAKRGFFNDDGLWIQYWQHIEDPYEEETERPDYAPELILGMAELTEKQRFCIELRYGLRRDCEQMTEAEIAALMGVSQPAVARLIQRGLAALSRGLSNSPMGA